jgi:hypothetical protein
MVNQTTQKQGILVFGIGIHAGFFSEINNMVLAIVYCLHHKIEFKLNSGNANFRLQEGWNDYFLPFCKEENNSLLDTYNQRYKVNYKTDFGKPRRMVRKLNYALMLRMTKIKSGADYLTFDLWDEICNRKLEKLHYAIPEFNINGDLQHACHQVLQHIWRFKSEVENEIQQISNSLNLPENYIGFQVRRGDKIDEHSPIKLEQYIDKASRRTDIRNAFILTDDYGVIKELKERYPEWNFYTLCRKSERGYTHNEFYNRERSLIYNDLVRLLANMEILRKSNFFIGTFSANPSMFLGMIMDKEKTISMDVPWQVWYGKEDETIKK